MKNKKQTNIPSVECDSNLRYTKYRGCLADAPMKVWEKEPQYAECSCPSLTGFESYIGSACFKLFLEGIYKKVLQSAQLIHFKLRSFIPSASKLESLLTSQKFQITTDKNFGPCIKNKVKPLI